MEFHAQPHISTETWVGSAIIPHQYLPANVSHFNAFAIHGAEDGEEDLAWEDFKVYESLYPTDSSASEPDFHNLEVFGDIDLAELGVDVSSEPSAIWKAALDGREISGLLP